MDAADLKYWIGFSLVPGIGRVKFSLLESRFGEMGKAWHASARELQEAGLDSRSVGHVLAARARLSLDEELAKMRQNNIQALTWHDPAYPARLKEVDDRPPVLYVRGALLPEDECAVAVVGTRRPSAYGRQVADTMSTELCRNGVTVVSGLARGIDAVAHKAALKAGGRTIAVFGCSLEVVYPPEHAGLARQIMERGALVSEFPVGTSPRADNFPRRNRIMSGMSLGVLVVEAGKTSGALITAHQAVEQNREVFAVPGSIFSPTSIGANSLVQEGAKLVTSCLDILEELNLSQVAQQLQFKEIAAASEEEAKLLACLTHEANHIDDIRHTCGLPIATVSSALTMLELKGLARQVGTMHYALA